MVKEKMKSPEWTKQLKKKIPSYGESFIGNEKLCKESRARTAKVLHLKA